MVNLDLLKQNCMEKMKKEISSGIKTKQDKERLLRELKEKNNFLVYDEYALKKIIKGMELELKASTLVEYDFKDDIFGDAKCAYEMSYSDPIGYQCLNEEDCKEILKVEKLLVEKLKMRFTPKFGIEYYEDVFETLGTIPGSLDIKFLCDAIDNLRESFRLYFIKPEYQEEDGEFLF